MLTADIRNKLLVDELQLGTNLNKAIHQNDRAYFNLLLSMLSPDVTDSARAIDPQKSVDKEDDLYLRLGVKRSRDNYAETGDFSRARVHADYIESGSQTALELSLCIHGEPLAFARSDLPPDIMANMSPLERYKTEESFDGKVLSHVPCDLRTLDIVQAIDASRSISNSI